METLKIPKFENETDEANWAYENRERLSEAFHEAVQQGSVRRGTMKSSVHLESVLLDALQTKKLAVTPEELTGGSLVSVLRKKLASMQSK